MSDATAEPAVCGRTVVTAAGRVYVCTLPAHPADQHYYVREVADARQ